MGKHDGTEMSILRQHQENRNKKEGKKKVKEVANKTFKVEVTDRKHTVGATE